ncbi:DarT ssDNA thymidine ADP-ribosyltransferase family protein [Pseudomonas sp. NPDC086112]|uniref:DarT ssDNA thymidine ADP-ribosyltransferase family protein n=1 Tax=Pseudomonas sp. NPDC086112 TaxID=3364430 RepID=UPI003821ED2C
MSEVEIRKLIKQRNIKSVVHFTTNSGSLGTFASKALKSRQLLNSDEQLQHIFTPNALCRDRDVRWLNYVNLSISQINTNFFQVAENNWHREKNFFWCILDFSPEILTHDGVFFSTTNNIYSDVRRGEGHLGLEAAFAPFVSHWNSKTSSSVTRPDSYPAHLPTCRQAEVLYPKEVSTEYLQQIYVRSESEIDELMGQMAITSHPNIPIQVAPELFAGIK